jgi:hypothetical protein
MLEIAVLAGALLIIAGLVLGALLIEKLSGRNVRRLGIVQLGIGVVPGLIAAVIIMILNVDLVDDTGFQSIGISGLVIAITVILVGSVLVQWLARRTL